MTKDGIAPITDQARKLIANEWADSTVETGLRDALRYLRAYEARLTAVEEENARLREALEQCDNAIQAWWPPQTTLSLEGVAVIEAGWLARNALSKGMEDG